MKEKRYLMLVRAMMMLRREVVLEETAGGGGRLGWRLEPTLSPKLRSLHLHCRQSSWLTT